MPLNDLAMGEFRKTLGEAAVETHEPMAMWRLGCCQGLVANALYSKELTYEEHTRLSAEVTAAIRTWHERNPFKGAV